MGLSTSRDFNDETDVRASFDVQLQADAEGDENSSAEHLTPENPMQVSFTKSEASLGEKSSENAINVQADAIGTVVIHNYPPDNQSSRVAREEKPNTSEWELTTDDVSRSIAIAKMVDQTLVVDDDALFKFLKRDDVEGRPLVIVSVAGAFRTGKSFLMNFFLRYLRGKGWTNKNWFGGDQTKITPYFPFERSTKGCTKNIRVCSEVFPMPLRDGRTAAVILVDTQGLYDAGMTADSNARIMSISMLFSSLQVFNILRQVESRHLESLQLWTSLSAASASFNLTSSKHKGFQDLKIVIRDFEHGDYAHGRNNTYLADVLENFSSIGEMHEVNRSVESAFSDLGCFLMPHPGKSFTRCRGQLIKNADMDEDFQGTVKELVEDVFDPENLSVKKKMDGKEADSTDLLHLLGQVGKAYENDEAPTAKTLMQVQVQADNTKALSLAVSSYEETMSQNCNGKFITDDDINKANEKAMKKAEDGFHDNAKMGNEKDKKEFFLQLQRECGDKLKSFYERNEEEKEKILTHGKYMIVDCTKRYRQAIQQKVENMTLEIFQLLHEKSKTENMARFDAEMKKHEQIAVDISKMRTDLESGIERTFATFEAQHKIQMIEKQEDEIKVLSTLFDDCIAEYRKMTLGKTDDDDSLTDLKTTLLRRKEEAIQLNTTERDYLIRTCEEEGNFLGNFFGSSLEEELVNGFIAKDCFQKYVGDFFSKYIKSLLEGNDKLPEWGKEIVRQNFDEKVAVIWRRNNDNKSFRSIRFEKLKKPSEKMPPPTRDDMQSSLRNL